MSRVAVGGTFVPPVPFPAMTLSSQHSPAEADEPRTYAKWLWRVALVAALALAGFLLYRTLGRYSFDDIVASITSIPLGRLSLALVFAACSYACLTLFDWFGLKYAGKPLPYPKAALASFVSLSIGHNIGVAALSSGAIRYRFYSQWGLDAGDVAKLVFFSGATVALGLSTLGGVAILSDPASAGKMTGLGSGTTLGLAVGCLSFPAIYLLLAAFLRSSVRIRKWTLEMPPLQLALAQLVIGPVNFVFVAACLHQLVAAFADVGYLETASVYVMASAAAIVSHVPGGLGVLETAILYLMPDGALIGVVIAFRFAYFLVPLVFGLLLLLFAEGRLFRKSRSKPPRAAVKTHALRTDQPGL